MNTTLSSSHRQAATPATEDLGQVGRDLVAAMPIVIFWRAVREILEQRAHRRAVLDAFRR